VPIYEYRRPDGTTFEVVQAFSDDALVVDPETGVPVERVLHPPAVHFKGTGFYNTDYGTRKRNRETVAAGEGKSSDKDSSSSPSGSSDKSSSSGSSSSSSDSGSGKASSDSTSGATSSEKAKSTKDTKKGSASKRSR
jgi:predicted nucleic acid-binding Zn ribbon protein